MNQQWSKDLMKLLLKLNNYVFSENSSRKTSIPFIVAGKKVGIITQKVATELLKYIDVFEFFNANNDDSQKCIKLMDKYNTFDERTKAIENVVVDLAKRNAHVSLAGWRNECYDVALNHSEKPLFKVERAAISMFGAKSYGSHMNGYVFHPEKGLCLWIAQRSKSKQTFPGMYDNMVAGGISSGIGIFETMVKECEEEAGIPKSIAKNVVPVGMISYVYEDERGIQPDVQFCFDLQLPLDFKPTPMDGEVENFKLCTIDEVKQLITDDNFKPNCAAITLDFLIRKGYVIPDEVPDYIEILQLLHYQL